jgi:putative flavoprotein involved in K+ transport
MPMTLEGTPVHIVGAGPGGLATAAALHERGISTVVLEKSGSIGASWRAHYDRLRMHTTRRGSTLPGLPIPRSCGRWVGRDDFVRYLESYVEHHDIEVATGVEVRRVERSDEQWVLHANGGRRLASPAVVVATGRHRVPHLPPWPGLDGYDGELLHSSDYRSAAPYAGKDVLVAGAGASGTEIAADLAAADAARVRLAVRTPPHLLRRSTLGWSAQACAVAARRLPARLLDAPAGRLAKTTVPDLAEYGLPRPREGLCTRAKAGAGPVPDTGFAEAVRKGRIEPVAAVDALDGGKVQLADRRLIAPDTVIAATGYRSELDGLVGHLGLLDGAGAPLVHGRRTRRDAPGLYFTGFTRPVSGTLRELGLDARRIARVVARAVARANR